MIKLLTNVKLNKCILFVAIGIVNIGNPIHSTRFAIIKYIKNKLFHSTLLFVQIKKGSFVKRIKIIINKSENSVLILINDLKPNNVDFLLFLAKFIVKLGIKEVEREFMKCLHPFIINLKEL